MLGAGVMLKVFQMCIVGRRSHCGLWVLSKTTTTMRMV